MIEPSHVSSISIPRAPRRTHFRPCIDIHDGHVKQIVGGTLSDNDPSSLSTNHVSEQSSQYFAELYKRKRLRGAHVIMLGQTPANTEAAQQALAGWPNALQIGGGISIDNAQGWIDRGADKVIVTSWLFPDAKFSLSRLKDLEQAIGRNRIVVDLSCRRIKGDAPSNDNDNNKNKNDNDKDVIDIDNDDEWAYIVAMNKWQTMTDTRLSAGFIAQLEPYCSEFLVHAADVEGLCNGIEVDLVKKLASWVTIPTTYAGGANNISDLAAVDELSDGRIDLTFGSALDIFGGTKVKFNECVLWNDMS